MKKCFFIFGVFVFVMICCTVHTESVSTHYIPELGLAVDVPIDILCVSRQDDRTNSFFKIENYDYDTVHQYMINNDVYLYGTTNDLLGLFRLIVTDYDIEDFQNLNDITLSHMGKEIESSFESQGGKEIKSEVYHGKTNKAIRLKYSYSTQEGSYYMMFYYTVLNSKLLTISFISSFSEISEKQATMIQNIFDSLKWGIQYDTALPNGGMDNSIYTDYETGLSFMVPSGWSEKKLISGDEWIKAKYQIGKDNIWFLYSSRDMWDELKEELGDLSDEYEIRKKSIGNEFLSKEMIAIQLNCSPAEISMITIEDQEYYCMNKMNSYTSDAGIMKTQDIVYVCMRDACIYFFHLTGMEIAKYEQQFNHFMKTVVYSE